MKTYNFSATVNYPDDEVDTANRTGVAGYMAACVHALLDGEPDATSFVIIISVNPEKKE